MSEIAENLARLSEEVLHAAADCGRDAGDICIVAVAKTFPRAAVEAALAAGQRVFGENRVREAEEKYRRPLPGAEMHMVGHLQSNKAAAAARLFDRIHSLDSPHTAGRLDRHLGETGRTMRALVQVNLGMETQKSGIAAAELPAFIRGLAELRNLVVDGLMVLPPLSDDPEEMRPHFRRLRELRDGLNELDLGGIRLVHLSMGMTADFPVAIAEGATLIRVGTAIFGPRGRSG